jgi:uncharacterized membrane protein
MSKTVAAIFPDIAKAREGNLVLRKLGAEGIAVHTSAIVFKNSDSKLSVLDAAYDGSHVTAVAALIGGLAGLPGGPLAAAIGAAGGALIGISAELTEKGAGKELVKRISDKLAPGNAAVVADIAEEGMSSFETRMSTMGGTFLRQP